jgi:hypothetical protein
MVSDDALRTVQQSFRRSSVKTPPTLMLLSAAPRQLSIPFDSARLRGMTPAERRISLARLASLLLEAANVVAEEGDDGER